MYEAVIHQNGASAFGENFLVNILDRHGIDLVDYNALSAGDPDKLQYDEETRDLIVAMLILKGSNNEYTLEQVEQQYALGTLNDDNYPNTVHAKQLFSLIHLQKMEERIVTTSITTTVKITTITMVTMRL
jgi:hypothetical protein